ncbi:MAG: bifunctional ornithine acetyltransferase/N-acetylglutamate synthase [Cyanobacteria bacterium SZAS LIN-3]|nr:bifunctional ornithine acetyltransferase/N-acetylglutamate synthase [Cyanobacteria bacterium SZAS LIN-3]
MAASARAASGESKPGNATDSPISTGGVTSPQGFMAAGAHIGVKRKRKDLALIWSEVPAHVAAAFTTNVMRAAPILWNEKVVAGAKPIRGIVVNSGNANACTGELGMINAEAMAATYGEAMGVNAEEIIIASTGVIGVQLPIQLIKQGIVSTCEQLDKSASAGLSAAQAIMTTDTYVKQTAVQFELDGKKITIGAMAKGSGMIHPNMATMLSFLTTDLNISPALLNKALKESTAETYNMISVDGDTSTNDMVAILANGKAGNTLIDSENADYFAFCQALKTINTGLAKTIVQDGEGATKFLEVQVKHAASIEEARKLARSIVSSSLVKTAFFGEDANWGRIICAMGYSGVQFKPETVSIAIESAGGKLELMQEGEPAVVNEILGKAVLAEKNIIIHIDMKEGASEATAWGCDLSYEYVRINGSYRT